MWVGNRRNPPADPNGLVFNVADELVVWPQQHTYDYHGTGSLAHQKDSSGATVQKTYAYTPANLLASVTHNSVQGEPVSSMTWDADSNRITFTSSQGGTYTFVYDATAGIPAVIEEVSPSGSVYYVREPNGALIARVAAGSAHYYHFDALGSTRLLTDDSGVKTDEYSYDAWGNTTHETGTTAQPYQYVGRLGYYTHVQDNQMDLLQLGVRFYDPETGRFTQVDPVHYGMSWYRYAGDRPTARVDPTGLLPGRYELCGDGDDWKSRGCRWCVKVACNFSEGAKKHCCNVDKMYCQLKCSERYDGSSDEWKACMQLCNVKAAKCYIDGRPFE